MPGFSEQCVGNAHKGCTDRQCRCECHTWTQNLIADNSRKNATQASAITTALTAVENKCPKCGSNARPTDTFCRRDGSRLVLGKQCVRCEAPQNSDDQFCFQCGWKCGEPMLEKPAEEEAQEDPLVRARRMAVDAGLLKETLV
jgi:hypothetical protein